MVETNESVAMHDCRFAEKKLLQCRERKKREKKGEFQNTGGKFLDKAKEKESVSESEKNGRKKKKKARGDTHVGFKKGFNRMARVL